MANLATPSFSASSETACVIYCRVSSAKQLREGDGLRGQERRCREYAQSKGYEVLRVFHEEGLTGSLLDRLAMDELLAFLKERGRETVVVIEDLKRFARDVSVHFSLKLALDACGGRLESPLFRFEDTPEGRFVETIVAAQAELERNQNRRQVRSRMLSRLEAGYWVFAPPPGYRYERDPVHKQVLVPDGRAELVREALEGFAAGRFSGQADVVRFLLRGGFFGPGNRVTSRHQNVAGRMLRQALYAGVVGYAPWKVTPREGRHPALITWETHRRILARLNTSQRPYSRREEIRADFELRGIISCASCGHPLTGSWSRGERQRYAYYHCHFRACSEYGKTIPKATLEEAFCRVLINLETPEVVMTMMEVLLTDHSRLRLVRRNAERSEAAQALKKMEEEINVRIEKLEGERIALSRRLAPVAEGELMQSAQSAGTAFLAVRGVLKNPYQNWKSGDTMSRHLIGRLVFDTLLAYDRKEGFGTVNLSLPYRVSRALVDSESRLVDQTGITSNNCGATNCPPIDWEELCQSLVQFAQTLTSVATTQHKELV